MSRTHDRPINRRHTLAPGQPAAYLDNAVGHVHLAAEGGQPHDELQWGKKEKKKGQGATAGRG